MFGFLRELFALNKLIYSFKMIGPGSGRGSFTFHVVNFYRVTVVDSGDSGQVLMIQEIPQTDWQIRSRRKVYLWKVSQNFS